MVTRRLVFCHFSGQFANCIGGKIADFDSLILHLYMKSWPFNIFYLFTAWSKVCLGLFGFGLGVSVQVVFCFALFVCRLSRTYLNELIFQFLFRSPS